MFLLTPSVQPLSARNTTMHSVSASTIPIRGTASARYIKENSLATKVAAVSTAPTYTRAVFTKFAAECKAEGIEVVESQAFTSDNKSDFSVALQKIKDSGAETCIPSYLLSGGCAYT